MMAVLKQKKRTFVENYRPIYLLSVVGKTLEEISW